MKKTKKSKGKKPKPVTDVWTPKEIARAKKDANRRKVPPSERVLRGEPIKSLPSAHWQIAGLVEGDGWYAIHQAKDQRQAEQYLSIVFDSDGKEYASWDDFAILTPELEFGIPTHIKGQLRAYLESTDPSTYVKRRSLIRTTVGATGSKKKVN